MSSLKQVGHLVRLLCQSGIEGRPESWKALFQSGLLSLVIRTAVRNPEALLNLNRKLFRRLLSLPEDEFSVFCRPNERAWVALHKIFGSRSQDTFYLQFESKCDSEPKGRFSHGELIEFNFETMSPLNQHPVLGITAATLSQLLWFCVDFRNYLTHQLDLVGTGNTYTVICGVAYPGIADSVVGVRLETGYKFSLVAFKWDNARPAGHSRVMMLAFPADTEIE